MAENNLKTLKESAGEDFFNALEKCVNFTIPKDIRNILQFNYYSSAITISKIDETSIQEIEEVMRTEFTKDMLTDGENITDYLFRYAENQKNFKLIGGQRKLILAMAEQSLKLYASKSTSKQDFRNSVPQTENNNQDEVQQGG